MDEERLDHRSRGGRRTSRQRRGGIGGSGQIVKSQWPSCLGRVKGCLFIFLMRRCLAMRFPSVQLMATLNGSAPSHQPTVRPAAPLAGWGGLRQAAEMVDDDCYISGGELLPDFEHRCKHNVNQKELAVKIRRRANKIEQAAQGGDE